VEERNLHRYAELTKNPQPSQPNVNISECTHTDVAELNYTRNVLCGDFHYATAAEIYWILDVDVGTVRHIDNRVEHSVSK